MIARGSKSPSTTSQWDANNDGIANSGTTVTATHLNDLTGTQQSYILLKWANGSKTKTSGQLDVTATGIDASGNTIFIATAKYWIGSTRNWSDTPITTNSGWDSMDNGGLGAGLHDYISGTITDGSLFAFAKYTWAEENGYLNSDSVKIQFDLKIDDGVAQSINVDTVEDKDFWWFSPQCTGACKMTPVPGRANTWFISGYVTEQPNYVAARFVYYDPTVTPKIMWGDATLIQNHDIVTYLTQKGGRTDHFFWTNPATSNLELWLSGGDSSLSTNTAQPFGDGRSWSRVEITGWTDNVTPTFGTFQDISGDAKISSNSPVISAKLTSTTNGMPDLIQGSANGDRVRFCTNSGTGASSTNAEYNRALWGANTLATTGVWSNTNAFRNIYSDTSNRLYVLCSNQLALDGTGAEGIGWSFRRFIPGADPTDPLQWTKEDIIHGLPTGTLVPRTGTGDIVSVQNHQFFYVNEAEVVNGEPTIYMSGTWGEGYIIRIQHNGGAGTDGSQWTVTNVIGNGTSTNTVQTNGATGLTSTVFNCRVVYADANYVYFADRQNSGGVGGGMIRRAEIANNYRVDRFFLPNKTPEVLDIVSNPAFDNSFLYGYRY